MDLHAELGHAVGLVLQVELGFAEVLAVEVLVGGGAGLQELWRFGGVEGWEVFRGLLLWWWWWWLEWGLLDWIAECFLYLRLFYTW